MPKPPSFSIITICYNEAAGIRDTCESIVTQTHKDHEWIIIDGGSTDGTLDIVKHYSESISILVSGPDEGIYDAMNKGLALAQGEYVIFMNGGDRFISEEALEWVDASPKRDLIYGDIVFDDLNGKRAYYPDQVAAGYLLKNMVPHQATFYRRSLFEQFGTYDTSYRIAADYDLYVRLLEIGKVSHHHINRPLAIFNRNGVSTSKHHRQIKKRENHHIRMKYFPRYRWTMKAWRQSLRNLAKSFH